MDVCSGPGQMRVLPGPMKSTHGRTAPLFEEPTNPTSHLFFELLGNRFFQTPKGIFHETPMSKAWQNIVCHMPIFRHFFLFCRVFVCFSVRSVQKHHKQLFNKKKGDVEFFYQQHQPGIKSVFFSVFVIAFFWMFLGKGS
jgi:hypothetical protein